jgi:hypothetical protein
MIVFDHLNKVSTDHGLYAKNTDLVCICKTKNQKKKKKNKEANKNLDWHTDTHPFLLCVWGILTTTTMQLYQELEISQSLKYLLVL